jgi:hypothetical protein
MPLADANLQVQFTLMADSISGAAEYEETHTLSTNSLGLFTTAFGAGTPVSNTFGNINWSTVNNADQRANQCQQQNYNRLTFNFSDYLSQ